MIPVQELFLFKTQLPQLKLSARGLRQKEISNTFKGGALDPKLGDVNKNGEFTLLDLAIVARHFGEKPTSLPQYNTDIDVNQAIDKGNLTQIARYMLANKNYKLQYKGSG